MGVAVIIQHHRRQSAFVNRAIKKTTVQTVRSSHLDIHMSSISILVHFPLIRLIPFLFLLDDCTSLDDCNGHGICGAPNECYCAQGWTNIDCSKGIVSIYISFYISFYISSYYIFPLICFLSKSNPFAFSLTQCSDM